MNEEKQPITPASYIGEKGVYASSNQIFSIESGISIVEIRGWEIARMKFETAKEAYAFLENMTRFVADAINEKLEREKR